MKLKTISWSVWPHKVTPAAFNKEWLTMSLIKLMHTLSQKDNSLEIALKNPAVMNRFAPNDILKLAAFNQATCQKLVNANANAENCFTTDQATIENLKNMLIQFQNLKSNSQGLQAYGSYRS